MNSQLLCFTVLLALVACVYTQTCYRPDQCEEGTCCARPRPFLIIRPPGECSDGMLGSRCGGRFNCGCMEGECRRGMCRERRTTTTETTSVGTTTTLSSEEPTTLPETTMQPTTQAPETTAA